jgi:hypothetical protein
VEQKRPDSPGTYVWDMLCIVHTTGTVKYILANLVSLPKAQLHGNEPSKGAKIDAELKRDDERRLGEKGLEK